MNSHHNHPFKKQAVFPQPITALGNKIYHKPHNDVLVKRQTVRAEVDNCSGDWLARKTNSAN
jgi:hypothetical protein